MPKSDESALPAPIAEPAAAVEPTPEPMPPASEPSLAEIEAANYRRTIAPGE